MPSRVIVGEAIWGSQKLAGLEPAWMRPEYTWIYSLAGPNGVFEFDARSIWAKCYAYARPDKTVEDVEAILTAFQKAGLLFTWQEEGRTYGFWTASNRPGRLPRKSWRERAAKNGKLLPDPPTEALTAFVSGGRCRSTPLVCSEHEPSVPGPGVGTVVGDGSGGVETLLVPSTTSAIEQLQVQQNSRARSDSREQTRGPIRPASERLAARLHDAILANNPDHRFSANWLDRWSQEVDRLLRIDKRDEGDIADLIDWSQQDLFWRANILSMGALRKHFDQLKLKKESATHGSRAHDRQARNVAELGKFIDDLGAVQREGQVNR